MAFLREVIFANYYGVSHEMEVFRLAFSLPNLLSQSVAPAFLGAVIPMLVAVENNKSDAIASKVIHANIIGTLIIAAIGVVFAQSLSRYLAPGFSPDQVNYLAGQLRLAFLFFVFLSLSFGLRAILNSRDVYWPSASASFIISTTMVVGCLLVQNLAKEPQWTSGLIMQFAVLSAVIVLFVHALKGHGDLKRYVLSFKTKFESSYTFKAIFYALAVVVFYKISYAFPRIIDRAIASELEAGVVAALDYSFGILNVPGMLFATSIVTLVFPSFARRIANEFRMRELRNYLWMFIAVVAVAAVAGLMISALSVDVVRLIYGRGSFDESAVGVTATLLKWHAIGLAPLVGSLILSQALFAHRAFMIAVSLVVVRVLAKWLAITVMVPKYGVVGLGTSFAVAEVVTFVLLLIAVLVLTKRKSAA